MKNFLSVFVSLLIVIMTILVGFAQYNQPTSVWGFAFVPLVLMMFCWGGAIYDWYKDE